MSTTTIKISPPPATPCAQGLVDLTDRLVAVLHSVGEAVRGGRTPHYQDMNQASTLALALLDEIEGTVHALGSTPADTPEGIEVRRQVADALAQLAIYQRVLEYARP